MTTERDRLVERRDLVSRDLAELATQVEDAEIDAATAEGLRKTYQAELDSLDSAIDDLGEPKPRPSVEVPAEGVEEERRRSPRAMIVGSLVVIAVLSVAIAFAARDDGSQVAEPIAAGPGELTVDPATVSDEQLEAVVAANPEIIAMRMALADRYFTHEDFSAALDHYLYIADNAPLETDESKALARVGWMAYLTGLPEAAKDYIEEGLRLDPANAEAVLYLGFVSLYGLDDAAAAIPQLEAALGLTGLSADVVSQIETALEEAGQAAP